MNEEIMFRFGGDLGPLDRSMKSAVPMVENFGKKLQDKFSLEGFMESSFKKTLKSVTSMFRVDMLSAITWVATRFGDLVQWATKQVLGDAATVKIGESLEKRRLALHKMLDEARAEQKADAEKRAKDLIETEKAARDTVQKLDEAAHARMMSRVAELGEATEAGRKLKLEFLKTDQAIAENDLKLAELTGNSNKQAEAEVKAEKARLDVIKAEADFEKDRIALQRSYNAEKANERSLERGIVEAKADRTKFTLQELLLSAQDRRRHGSFLRGPEMQASQIAQLEEQARLARFFGNGGRADQLTDRALALRQAMGNVLTSNEADPMRSMGEGIKKSTEHLREILHTAKESGIVIRDDGT